MIGDYLREILKFVVLVFVRPILRAIIFLVKLGFQPLFDWLNDRAHQRNQERLDQDLRRGLPWIFDKYHGRIIPNTRENPRVFDYAVVTVIVGNVLIRFVRGRDELRADVAPACAPDQWDELGDAIREVSIPRKPPPKYYRIGDLGRVLEQHLEQLDSAYSQANK